MAVGRLEMIEVYLDQEENMILCCEHPSVYSFNKYLLATLNVPNGVVGDGVQQNRQSPCAPGIYSQWMAKKITK